MRYSCKCEAALSSEAVNIRNNESKKKYNECHHQQLLFNLNDFFSLCHVSGLKGRMCIYFEWTLFCCIVCDCIFFFILSHKKCVKKSFYPSKQIRTKENIGFCVCFICFALAIESKMIKCIGKQKKSTLCFVELTVRMLLLFVYKKMGGKKWSRVLAFIKQQYKINRLKSQQKCNLRTLNLFIFSPGA